MYKEKCSKKYDTLTGFLLVIQIDTNVVSDKDYVMSIVFPKRKAAFIIRQRKNTWRFLSFLSFSFSFYFSSMRRRTQKYLSLYALKIILCPASAQLEGLGGNFMTSNSRSCTIVSNWS